MSIYENTPCMGCEEREIGCHSRCDRYGEWADKKDKARTALYEARIAEIKADDCLSKSARRRRRRAGNRGGN